MSQMSAAGYAGRDDVRMRGFHHRATVVEAVTLIDGRVGPLPPEPISVLKAAGRVLAAPVTARVDVPGFDRSAMDGYAVRALPGDNLLEFTVVGEAFPGRPFPGEVDAGEAVRIATGAPIPAGCDAVVVAEAAREENGRVVFTTPAIAGRHMGRRGEDVMAGREVLPAGRRLRPQDVGLIAAVGLGEVTLIRQPRVAILATGNELLPPGSLPHAYHIADSNSPMLAALIARDGGIPLPVHYLRDTFETVRDAIHAADADAIVVSGGTSVGPEDHVPSAVAALGELAVHGIHIKPGGPLGIGFVSGKPIFLLPGNPVSCLCGYDLFAGRAVRRLGGRDGRLPYPQLTLPLATDLASVAGRVDYVRVRVDAGSVQPILTGSSVLSSTVTADGFILVDAEREELPTGEMVIVHLYDFDPFNRG